MTDVVPTTEDAERSAADPVPAEPEPEVRAEEFHTRMDQPKWASPLPDDAVEALSSPLDPNRVRKRAGRGSVQYEYLAGHDVKRRANEIFGFGNWGYTVVELREIAAVEVANSNGREGWHVGYSATVEVTVRGCYPFSDVGYGDGVEYGAAARVQACELATKEAVTDAMKRALTAWGDQFGLILYAKVDERKRIDTDVNRSEATQVVRRDNEANVPRNFAEVRLRMTSLCGSQDIGDWWVGEAIHAKYGVLTKDLTPAQKRDAGQRAAGLVIDLENAAPPEGYAFATGVRDTFTRAIAKRFDGVKAEGPPWALGPDEAETYPQRGVAEKDAPAEAPDVPAAEPAPAAVDETKEADDGKGAGS